MLQRHSIGCVFLLTLLLMPCSADAEWYRGNTHAHTLNTDGNASPDVVVRWYREHGYHFVVITDHDFLTDVAPLQALFGADGKFLVIKGEEVSQAVPDARHPDGTRQAHVNAINASRLIIPIGKPLGFGRIAPPGTTIAETYARNLAEIRAAGGIAQINHPNFRWSVGVEDMAQLPDNTLFELWNGQPDINNLGGTDDQGNTSLSTEALWDALLSRGKRLWGVACDDSHYFHDHDRDKPNLAPPGRAWVYVRADRLTPEAIVAALEKGDFYASTGVTLEDYAVSAREIALQIKQPVLFPTLAPDSRFLTRFIGKGGRILAEVSGTRPAYTFRGAEGYVRAAITDSSGRRAWTQPVFLDTQTK